MNLTGLQDYLEKLARAEREVDAAADEALAAAGPILFSAIQPLIPVATGDLFFHLRMNGPIRRDNEHFLYVEIDIRERDEMLKALAQEFGTPTQAAQPYIRPGVQAGRARARQAMKAVFEQYLEAL